MAAASTRQKEAPMKVKIAGGSPMERLTNFTKRVIAVDKSELPKLEKKWRARKSSRVKRS